MVSYCIQVYKRYESIATSVEEAREKQREQIERKKKEQSAGTMSHC